MLKTFITLVLAAGLCACSKTAYEQTEKQKHQFDRALLEVTQGWGQVDKPLAGLSAIRIKDGEIAYAFYSGEHTQIQRKGVVPPTADSLYRIASISKTITAIAAMQLVEQDKLDIDADASQYLGFALRNPAFPDTKITPRMLLSNTSSIVDGAFYSVPLPYKMSDLFTKQGTYWQHGERFLNANAMNGKAPGDFFYYANINFGLLGSIIEKVSGLRFDEYVVQNIFAPLGIEASYNTGSLSSSAYTRLNPIYRWQEGKWVAQVDNNPAQRLADNVTVENPDTMTEGKGTAPFASFSLGEYELGSNGTLFSPQGGLRISLRDLASIAMMMMNRGQLNGSRVLKSSTVEAMEISQWAYDGRSNGNTYDGLMQSYGLGIHQLLGKDHAAGGDTPFTGYKGGLVGHSGDAYGLLSGMYYDAGSGDGYVYFITGTPSHQDNWGEYSTFYVWEEAIFSILNSVE